MKKIKSAILKKYDYVLPDINSEELELKGGLYSKTTYDENGRTLSEIKFDAAGRAEEHYEYEYNEAGARTAERSFDEDGTLVDHMEYHLDPSNRILFGYKHYADGSQDTITYRYDPDGKLVEKEVRTDEDELEQLDRFGYSGDKQVLHEAFDEDHNVIFKKETVFDGQGHAMEERTWTADSDEVIRQVNEYDEQGELQSTVSLDENDNALFRITYVRDEDQHIVEVNENSPGRTVQTLIEYDEKGNAVLQVEKGAGGEVNSRIERTFDEHGNVLQSEALIDRHGLGMNQHYILKYEYEMY